MAKRHSDALFIQQGACNPAGISRALHEACKECLDESVSQREDAAVRLIVHQLAYLCNIGESIDGVEYHRLMTECEDKAKASDMPVPKEPARAG